MSGLRRILGGPLDLPLERDGSGRFLPWIVALMVYIAALALAGMMAKVAIMSAEGVGASRRERSGRKLSAPRAAWGGAIFLIRSCAT